MRFDLRPPLIIFHDDRPGQHATMFAADGRRLLFRGDVSHFNDAERRYAWAFEGAARHGDTIVFATSDREVVGKVVGELVQIAPADTGGVSRRDDKPLDLTGSLLPTVEALLAPPHPRPRPRPVPLVRRGAR